MPRLFAAFLIATLLAAAIHPAKADTTSNKALIESFYRDVFVARNAGAAPKYLKPDCIQHNPQIPSGLAGFQGFFGKYFGQPKAKNYAVEILKLVAEGDLVVAYVRWSDTGPDGKPVISSGFDMYRIESDKIAEHWEETNGG